MTRLPVLLVLLLACTDAGSRPEARPASTDSMLPITGPPPFSTAPPLRVLAAAPPASTVDTVRTPYLDSIRVGDTVSFERGYRERVTRVTERSVVESTWVRRPIPVPVPVLGLPLGVFKLPPAALCDSLGFTATATNTEAGLTDRLADVRRCRGWVAVILSRGTTKDSTGLSVAKSTAEITRIMPWACTHFQAGRALLYIGDDVNKDAEWGPAPLAVRLARYDTIARNAEAICPGTLTVLRALPTQLTGRTWQWLDAAWAQYIGLRPSRGHGTPAEFAARQIATAQQLKLGLVLGLNVLNAGCGPPTSGWCLPGVPGTSIPGSEPGFYQVSAAEYLHYKRVFVRAEYVCASVDWTWSPAYEFRRTPEHLAQIKAYHVRPDVVAASRSLAALARTRPARPCTHPDRR